MKIGVMGAGAVGCFYGGMLARAGHAVVLIGRPQHVDAIRRDGLHFDSPAFRGHIALSASSDAAALADADLVLCCVKSTDTGSAAADIAPQLAADTIVLSLQNGVDNAARLQGVLQREVLPAVVYVAAGMPGPGQVRHNGGGELVIGPSAVSDTLVRLFGDAGVPVKISDNVAGALWSKLILNCAYNALSAISQLPYGELVQGEGVEAVMRDIVDECLVVARADGIDIPGDIREAVRCIAETMPTQRSSTAQDLARGKRSEIDHLNGYVIRRGEALGIATPVNRVLHTLVKLAENTGFRLSPE